MNSKLLQLTALSVVLAVSGYTEAFSENSRTQAEIIFNQAEQLRKRAGSTEDLKQAFGKYQEALNIYRGLAAEKEIGRIHNGLGLIQLDWGQFALARHSFEQALEIARRIGDKRADLTALNNLGLVNMMQGDYREAIKYYRESLDLKKKRGYRRLEAITLNNLGMVNWEQGSYDRALKYYDEAKARCVEFGNTKGEALVLDNIGLVYAHRGQYKLAEKSYQDSQELRKGLNDIKGESNVLSNLGLLYYFKGKYEQAKECFTKALELSTRLGDERGQGEAWLNIGRIHQRRGESERAMECYHKGLALFEKIGFRVGMAKALLGRLYLDLGQLDKARDCYEAVEKKAQSGNAEDLFTAWTGMGMTCEMMGDYPRAAHYYQKAVELTERLRSAVSSSQRERFFDVDVLGFYRTAPYEGLARVLRRMGKDDQAFTITELTKARVFAESMSRRAGKQPYAVPPEVAKEDARLTNQLAALSQQLRTAHEKNNDVAVTALAPEIKQLEEEFSAHKKMLREQHPLFAETKYPEPMDLARTALRDDEWVLSFDVTDSGVLIYLTQGKKLVKAVFKDVPRKDVDHLIRKFREPMKIKPAECVGLTPLECLRKALKRFDFTAGKALSDILLADILPELHDNTPLIIIPDDSLGILPFEMLVLSNGGKIATDKSLPYVTGAEFFGDRNPISYYQSVTALTLARTYGTDKKGGQRLLVMADPIFSLKDARSQQRRPQETEASDPGSRMDADLMVGMEEGQNIPRLPLTEKLAEALEKGYKGSTDRYTGLDATKETFLNNIAPQLSRYNSIVFATHGYFGKDLPGIMEPVLVLCLVPPGTDGYLRMSEVMGLKTDADMVALTACQTGLGRRISGEGAMSMGRAFQYAGAKSVLMSFWSVAESSSVMLVESFFQQLKEGKGKLEALQLAREKIRKKGYDHPFFWASFILAGETD